MTRDNVASEIETLVRQVKGRYEQLVLVVGPAGSGITEALRQVERSTGYPYVSLGLDLSQRLLEIPARRRPFQASRAVESIVEDRHSEVVFLDNLELLFDRSLHLNPLSSLRKLSRSRVIVAAWPGSTDGTWITYAAPGHREYRRELLEQTLVTRT